jgi:hypothetical protein
MTKCLTPWTNIDISPTGNITPCCKFQMSEYVDKFNIIDCTIDEYRSSSFLKTIQSEMTQDKWPLGCVRCKTEEENNVLSKRQLDYCRWKEQYDSYDDQQGFIVASIAFGNVCNLKCITCGPTASSRWRKEHKQLYNKDIKPIEFIDNITSDHIYSAMPNIIHFDIPGGEPFLSDVDKQKSLLNKYIQSGQSKNITIHYTTNVQVYPGQEWWDLWKHFKEIDIQLSIDGIGERYEYIRYPGKWSVCEENTKRYVTMEEQTSNLKLSVSHTVSAYNIYYMDEFFNWCAGIGLPRPWCGRVHTPEHMRPSVYPVAIMKQISDNLMSSVNEDCHTWASLIENTDDSQYFPLFKTMKDKHDIYRGTNFAQTFPQIERLNNGL